MICKECNAEINVLSWDGELRAIEVTRNGYHQEISYNDIDQANKDIDLISDGACPCCDGWEDGKLNYVNPEVFGEKIESE